MPILQLAITSVRNAADAVNFPALDRARCASEDACARDVRYTRPGGPAPDNR